LAGEMMGLLGIAQKQEIVLWKEALACLPARAGKLAKLAELPGWVRSRGQRGYNELSCASFRQSGLLASKALNIIYTAPRPHGAGLSRLYRRQRWS
jgi:hypothetical protein